MSNFKTKCINCDISTTFVPLGSSRVSKEAKNFKKLEFLGLGCCFSVRTEESLKTSKIQPKTTVLWRFFKICSILAEKQQPKPKNSSSLKVSASFDSLLDPGGAKVKEISQSILLYFERQQQHPLQFSSLSSKQGIGSPLLI